MSEVVIRTGKANMDVEMIHTFLSTQTYWAKDIPFVIVDDSLANSYCAGAFIDGVQVGFGRVITDYNTFGWFADFFVLPEYRGKSIAKKLLTHIMGLPWSHRLRRKMLNTRDAHGLYRGFKFTELSNPSFLLEVYNPDAHLQHAGGAMATDNPPRVTG